MAELEFIWRPFTSTLPGMKAWVAFAGPYQYAVAHNHQTKEWFASVRFAKGGTEMTDLCGGDVLLSELHAKHVCRKHWQAYQASQR
jgi:hypothetical protein